MYADNPQVYSNEVYIFDNKRGSGESIWDIKDKIAFYSTELYRYFDKSFTVDESIRYLLQNPYKKRELLKEDLEFKEFLLNYFNLEKDGSSTLNNLSPEYQRLVMIIAAFIKNCPLLILDEPFQGFNEDIIEKALFLINDFIKNKTFILVTHNREEIPSCIQKNFLLKNGKGTETTLPK